MWVGIFSWYPFISSSIYTILRLIADCNCDVKGTLPGVCDKSNGQCLCKPGYGGPRCDQCVANFTGFPDCKPCNCSTKGSASTVCDINGKCTCLNNYAGKLCDQCSPGNYQYPDCHGKNMKSIKSDIRSPDIILLI